MSICLLSEIWFTYDFLDTKTGHRMLIILQQATQPGCRQMSLIQSFIPTVLFCGRRAFLLFTGVSMRALVCVNSQTHCPSRFFSKVFILVLEGKHLCHLRSLSLSAESQIAVNVFLLLTHINETHTCTNFSSLSSFKCKITIFSKVWLN